MRELKFRAWVNDHWVDWIPTCKTLGAYNASIIDTDGYTFEEDNPFIVEQYTGLTDKNGKEIYEGDIVKITRELTKSRTAVYIYQIKYDGSRAAFTCWKNNHFSCMFFESNEGECEVIGNIHEPPKDFRPEHLKRMGVSISKGGEE